jgi:hypothetical protein
MSLHFAQNRGLCDLVDEKAETPRDLGPVDVEGEEDSVEVGLVELLVALCDDVEDVGRLEAVCLAVQ